MRKKLTGMNKPITQTQGWLSINQAADYIGMSRKSIDKAVKLKEQNKCNATLRLKYVGNQKRISRKSLDETEKIITTLK
ncbi:hypothetical protein [uncultured Mediterranean phage uvMED]|nr:hypothetical protein [uncultured Mediterranean phage uvMED]